MSIREDWRVWTDTDGSWKWGGPWTEQDARTVAASETATAAQHGIPGRWLALPADQTPDSLPHPDCAGSGPDGRPCFLPPEHDGPHLS